MFDPAKTIDIQKIVVEWNSAPIAKLLGLFGQSYRYGYIGTEDRTMYPLIMPGAIVQIDEQRKSIVVAQWQNEFERPIYFLETHDGYVCCWCTRQPGSLILQPHPLSPEVARVLRLGEEVEVVGQVVGVAMRLALDVRRLVFDRDERRQHASER